MEIGISLYQVMRKYIILTFIFFVRVCCFGQGDFQGSFIMNYVDSADFIDINKPLENKNNLSAVNVRHIIHNKFHLSGIYENPYLRLKSNTDGISKVYRWFSEENIGYKEYDKIWDYEDYDTIDFNCDFNGYDAYLVMKETNHLISYAYVAKNIFIDDSFFGKNQSGYLFYNNHLILCKIIRWKKGKDYSMYYLNQIERKSKIKINSKKRSRNGVLFFNKIPEEVKKILNSFIIW